LAAARAKAEAARHEHETILHNVHLADA